VHEARFDVAHGPSLSPYAGNWSCSTRPTSAALRTGLDMDEEPGSAFSTDREEDPRLAVERLMSQLVDQASVIMTAQ